jgi:hypothetical protein
MRVSPPEGPDKPFTAIYDGGLEEQCERFQYRSTMEVGKSSFKTFPDWSAVREIFLYDLFCE